MAPALHRVDDLRGRGRGVADGDTHAGRHEVLDERDGARHFGRERHQPDAAVADVLAALEVVDSGRRDVRAPVSAARAVLGRDVRALHVDPGDGRMPRGRQGANAGGEFLGATT